MWRNHHNRAGFYLSIAYLLLVTIGCGSSPTLETATPEEPAASTVSAQLIDIKQNSIPNLITDVAVPDTATIDADVDTDTQPLLPPLVEIDCTSVRKGRKTWQYSKINPKKKGRRCG